MRLEKVRNIGVALVLAVVAVVAVTLAMKAGRSIGLQEEPEETPTVAAPSPTPSPTPTPTATGDIPPGFVEFRDQEAGVSIAYPAQWERIPTAGSDLVLVATPNDQDSLAVRVTRLDVSLNERSLRAVKNLADRAVTSAPGVELLSVPDEVTLGGAKGYFYFYKFRDTASGRTGAHSHYVLFEDGRMISVIFQALPKSRFVDLAPVFDRIAATFRVHG